MGHASLLLLPTPYQENAETQKIAIQCIRIQFTGLAKYNEYWLVSSGSIIPRCILVVRTYTNQAHRAIVTFYAIL